MRVLILNLFLLILFTVSSSYAETEFYLCPLCDQSGNIICPAGYEAGCLNSNVDGSLPKCLFLDGMYAPGCWKFEGIKKIDIGIDPSIFPPSWMAMIEGGGETYTVNKDTVGCKKL